MTQPEGPLPSRTEKLLESLGIGVVGILVIFLVCAVVAVVALALLGPAIGNVFSNVILSDM